MYKGDFEHSYEHGYFNFGILFVTKAWFSDGRAASYIKLVGCWMGVEEATGNIFMLKPHGQDVLKRHA